MSRVDPSVRLAPSLMDRLCEPDAGGTATRPGYDYAQLVQAVARDIEDLLNAHQLLLAPATRDGPLGASLLAYGLPDLSGLCGGTEQDYGRLARLLEATIVCHEPRLRNVRATVVAPDQGLAWHLCFRIEAELAFEPHPLVALETVMELAGGRHRVRQIGR
jgi:type VI secretion system protein ImpF